MRKGVPYIVSSEDAHDLATAIELNENALLEVLVEVRKRQLGSALETHLLEFRLCLRHLGGKGLFVSVGGSGKASGEYLGWLCLWGSRGSLGRAWLFTGRQEQWWDSSRAFCGGPVHRPQEHVSATTYTSPLHPPASCNRVDTGRLLQYPNVHHETIRFDARCAQDWLLR